MNAPDPGTAGSDRRRFIGRLGLAGLALAAGAGCAGRDSSRGLAQVTVRARSPQVVALAVEQVFQREGFRGNAHPAQMIFTRDGGTGTDLAYGGWVSGAITEVEVFILRMGQDLYEVWCTAYKVRDPGDRVLADRQELTRVHAGTYRRLLAEARALVESDANPQK